MIWRKCGTERSWPSFSYCLGIYLELLKKSRKSFTISHVSPGCEERTFCIQTAVLTGRFATGKEPRCQLNGRLRGLQSGSVRFWKREKYPTVSRLYVCSVFLHATLHI
jgi:hypothetical protein